MNLAGARARIARWWPTAPAAADAHGKHTHCANCGEPIVGAYCPRCGQETTLALPSARAFLREAAGRYIAWDGRTWRTLAALFFRPGFLTREYLAGRRRRYVRPGRLFLVLALALFAVIRFTTETPEMLRVDSDAVEKTPRPTSERTGVGFSIDDNFDISLGSDIGWLAPLQHRIDQFNKLTRAQKSEQLWAGMLRYGPYAMVALLPLFALLMKVAYAGRTRRYPDRPRRYAAHLVYAAHNHAFAALALIVWNAVPISALQDIIAIWMAVYFAWSMKTVYGGRWSGVVLRALLIGACYFVLFVIAVLGLVVVAIALK